MPGILMDTISRERPLTAESRMGRRGSALIAVLLVTTAMLVLGLGLLSQKARQHDAAARNLEGAQARAIAQAGLVDCEIKLRKDPNFPPKRPEGLTTFSYSEVLRNPDGIEVGRYTVAIDNEFSLTPFNFLKVVSRGEKGSARYTIYAEMDLSPLARNGSGQPNPDYKRWLHLVEQEQPYRDKR